jgi:hypothetical protein
VNFTEKIASDLIGDFPPIVCLEEINPRPHDPFGVVRLPNGSSLAEQYQSSFLSRRISIQGSIGSCLGNPVGDPKLDSYQVLRLA